jgi:protoporphyrin/coproporphyrin ferrochelatase
MTTVETISSEAQRFVDDACQYDAVLIVSFGGPEGPADVMPFLENVTRGRKVPRARLLEVAHHYEMFGGVSPINTQNRALADALEAELRSHGVGIPVYLGNRNWHPFLGDTIRHLHDRGARNVLAFVTSAFSCYSACRQYREDLIRACDALGEAAPQIDKVRVFYNHPAFIEANARHLRAALSSVPPSRRDATPVVFTAHSIPRAMARTSDYEVQLAEASALVAAAAGAVEHSLAYQSRSGSPWVPWLEPDVMDVLRHLAERGTRDVVILPIGFVSDHMEVLYDLDVEAASLARDVGINMLRAATVGTSPPFVRMVRELIQERMTARPVRRAVGQFGPGHDVCPLDCCLAGGKPGLGAR